MKRTRAVYRAKARIEFYRVASTISNDRFYTKYTILPIVDDIACRSKSALDIFKRHTRFVRLY